MHKKIAMGPSKWIIYTLKERKREIFSITYIEYVLVLKEGLTFVKFDAVFFLNASVPNTQDFKSRTISQINVVFLNRKVTSNKKYGKKKKRYKLTEINRAP